LQAQRLFYSSPSLLCYLYTPVNLLESQSYKIDEIEKLIKEVHTRCVLQEVEQQKDINYTYAVLEGTGNQATKTWNFVNYTSTGTGTKIFEKGTITFGGGFKETVDNRTIWQGLTPIL
jgi:hypothetical protein